MLFVSEKKKCFSPCASIFHALLCVNAVGYIIWTHPLAALHAAFFINITWGSRPQFKAVSHMWLHLHSVWVLWTTFISRLVIRHLLSYQCLWWCSNAINYCSSEESGRETWEQMKTGVMYWCPNLSQPIWLPLICWCEKMWYKLKLYRFKTWRSL